MFYILWTIILYYFYLISFAFITTASLILFGSGWGVIPHKYLKVVEHIRELFSKYYDQEKDGVPWIEKNLNKCVLARSQSTVTADDMQFQFDLDKENILSAFDVGLDLAESGIQSIIQDEVSQLFGYSPDYLEFELTKKIWINIQKNLALKTIFIVSIIFRYCFLGPVRLLLLLSSFIFAGFWCIVVLFKDLSNKRKTWIAVIYCRLFCAGIGLVARYHNQDKKPKRPGIAVSNHLSPNDIQIICADVESDRDYLYIVTGQKHSGIIWAIERLVERLCPSLWFDRANMKDRREFIELIMNEGKKAGPVLLFPEGYCTNNTRVLQFRKAVFVDDIIIHPIAIKQDAKFSDNFWSEDLFHNYLIRVLTSWACVYDIYYLDPETKRKDETSDEFASRIQHLIASKINRKAVNFDGSIWYKKHEREKYMNALKEKCSNQYKQIIPDNNEIDVLIDEENNSLNFDKRVKFSA